MKLIDADEAVNFIKNRPNIFKGEWEVDDFTNYILEQPTVEAEPIVYARWERFRIAPALNQMIYRCTRCGRTIPVPMCINPCNVYPYCHCGAKMK